MKSLEKIIALGRPYVQFQFSGETLYARKLSQSDSDSVGKAWQAAYNAENARLLSNPDETVFSGFKRADPKALAKFIARADMSDLQYQASSENDDAPLDSEEVKERTKELVAEREADILDKVPPEKMMELAMARRAHFLAADHASNMTMHMRARLMTFDEDKNPLFDTDESIKDLPGDIFQELLSAVLEALTPKKPEDEVAPDPLT